MLDTVVPVPGRQVADAVPVAGVWRKSSSGMIANASFVSDTAFRGWAADMPAQSISSINPGDVDTEIAERAARRITEYLDGHPDEDLIEALGEIGTGDALVIPRATVILFAQILDLLAQGRGVQILPKVVELSTQQAADALNV